MLLRIRTDRLLLGCVGFCFLFSGAPARGETQEERYKRVCLGDSDNKERGVDKPAKEEPGAIIRAHSELIYQVAEKYHIDPRAIVGSILAEHSMNTGTKDMAENFLVKKGVASRGKLFGKEFTFGFG